jgi:hypothetical protein
MDCTFRILKIFQSSILERDDKFQLNGTFGSIIVIDNVFDESMTLIMIINLCWLEKLNH